MRRLRSTPVLLLWLSAIGHGMPQAADPPAPRELRNTRLYLLVSQSLIGTFNKDDATAILGIWINQLCEIERFRCDSRVNVAYSLADIRRRIRERSVDLLLIDTNEYVLLAHEGLVEAVAAGSNRGKLAAYSYLLLKKDESGTASIAGLRGKRMVVASRTGSNLGLIWLDTLLAENKLDRAASFFGSIDVGNRASSCVLSLFFGKIDACVVDSGNWETIAELNPQVRRLRILARSEPLLEMVVAMPIQPQHPYKREIVDSIFNLHRTVAGDQLGTIFKTGPQVAVTIKDFESVANLLNRYRGLLKSSVDLLNPVVGRLNDIKEAR